MYQIMTARDDGKMFSSVSGWRRLQLQIGDNLSLIISPEELQDLRNLCDVTAAGYEAWIAAGQPADLLNLRIRPDEDYDA